MVPLLKRKAVPRPVVVNKKNLKVSLPFFLPRATLQRDMKITRKVDRDGTLSPLALNYSQRYREAGERR